MSRQSKVIRCDAVKAKAFRARHFSSANAAAKDIKLNVKTIRLIESGEGVSQAKVQLYAEKLGISIKDIAHDDLDQIENPQRIVAFPTSSELFNLDNLKRGGDLTRVLSKSASAHFCDVNRLLKLIKSAGLVAGGKNQPFRNISSINKNPVWMLVEGVDATESLSLELGKLDAAISKTLEANKGTLKDLIANIDNSNQITILLNNLNSVFGLHVLGVIINTEYELEINAFSDIFEPRVEFNLPVFYIAPNAVREVYFSYEAFSSDSEGAIELDLDGKPAVENKYSEDSPF